MEENAVYEKLVNSREYLVNYNGESLFLFYKNGSFYDGYQDFPFTTIDKVESVEKSPNFDNKILIDGSYGDPVVLYLDGYVGTKSGDFFKIKYVDIVNESVHCYGDKFDFSRISYSQPNTEISFNQYSDYIKSKLDRIGVRTGSVIKVNDEEVKVVHIDSSNLSKDYSLDIVLENGIIKFINENIDVVFTPLTKEEEVKKIIDDNCGIFDSRIKDKKVLIKELIKYFEKNG